jgi:NTE family protein
MSWENLDPGIEHFVVRLCPLVGSPYDFSRTEDHIARAIQSTDAWLAQGGIERGILEEMRPHSHGPLRCTAKEIRCVTVVVVSAYD